MVFGNLFRSSSSVEATQAREAAAGPPSDAAALLKPVVLTAGTDTARLGGRAEEAEADGEEQEWELIEAPANANAAEPVVIDDYLVVEGSPRESEVAQEDGSADVVAATEPGDKARPDDESEGGSTTTDDEPSFRCLSCRSPVFKAFEIVSSNYHAQTSPGYLTSAIRNVQVSDDMQTATYTTGKYTIQEVSCQACSAVLGVTYSAAADARNQYKVGKFLIGRDRLQLPPGVTHPMDKVKI